MFCCARTRFVQARVGKGLHFVQVRARSDFRVHAKKDFVGCLFSGEQLEQIFVYYFGYGSVWERELEVYYLKRVLGATMISGRLRFSRPYLGNLRSS